MPNVDGPYLMLMIHGEELEVFRFDFVSEVDVSF